MERLTLNPADLLPGDVVLEHGMRCLVEHEPKLSTSHSGETYWTSTVVLNREDVPNEIVPYSFTSTASYPSRGMAPSPDPHRWTIQGNRLHWVYVDRPDCADAFAASMASIANATR